MKTYLIENLFFRKLLKIFSVFLFVCAGGMTYAYVLDLEPLPLDKEYLLERDRFNRTNDDYLQSFPSFSEWVTQQENREKRFKDWVNEVLDRIGNDSAGLFDPSHIDRYVDTREGAPGAAPENWYKGERD